ncbi:MAG: transcription antitermination factor NusB [Pseudomonadota bacterium]
MTQSALAPRRAALHVLSGVLEDKKMLDEALAEAPSVDRLWPGDRARALRLARETLRQIGRCDALLKPNLRRRPPPGVQNILRLALTELAEGEAAHGVVSSAVALTRKSGGERFAGLVNAVLRKTASEVPAGWAGLPPTRLPGWLRGRLDSTYGRKIVEGIEAAHAVAPPTDLSVKSGTGDLLARTLGAERLPTGSLRLATPGQVSALSGFSEGQWWVQDAAAAIAAQSLAAKPGERVLDLCAAPGGKTLQLAEAGADVTALDISEARMARVAENLSRTGLKAGLVVADALTWSPDTPFDAILLDAPCSATGTIRRHPDLPLVKSAADLKPLYALQSTLLDRALGWLKPDGRLVYATCSLLPEEGEHQIDAALARHAGLGVDRSALTQPGIDPDWLGSVGLRLRPDYWAECGGMDGFFVTALKPA